MFENEETTVLINYRIIKEIKLFLSTWNDFIGMRLDKYMFYVLTIRIQGHVRITAWIVVSQLAAAAYLHTIRFHTSIVLIRLKFLSYLSKTLNMPAQVLPAILVCTNIYTN